MSQYPLSLPIITRDQQANKTRQHVAEKTFAKRTYARRRRSKTATASISGPPPLSAQVWSRKERVLHHDLHKWKQQVRTPGGVRYQNRNS